MFLGRRKDPNFGTAREMNYAGFFHFGDTFLRRFFFPSVNQDDGRPKLGVLEPRFGAEGSRSEFPELFGLLILFRFRLGRRRDVPTRGVTPLEARAQVIGNRRTARQARVSDGDFALLGQRQDGFRFSGQLGAEMPARLQAGLRRRRGRGVFVDDDDDEQSCLIARSCISVTTLLDSSGLLTSVTKSPMPSAMIKCIPFFAASRSHKTWTARRSSSGVDPAML